MSTLNELFDYDAGTGILRYKKPRIHCVPGNAVGTRHKSGYLVARVEGKYCWVHRIIWELINGPIPKGLFIDHIDGNCLNNRLANLRLVTNRENLRNARRYSHSKHEAMGIAKRANRWIARIRVDSKLIHLGSFMSKKEAIAARKAAEQKYGFHPNHGRTLAAQPEIH